MARRVPKPGESERLVVQVSFQGGEDLPILFANHIFVRTGADGCLVSFAQSHGPYQVDMTPEELQRVGVEAKIIARLLIPTNRVREMADIFNGIVERLDSAPEE